MLCRKIATLFAGFTLFIWIEKAVQRFFLRHRFIVSFTFVCFFTFLHRLVGLRLLRLCLKLRQGFALYPQGTLLLTLQALYAGLEPAFYSLATLGIGGHNFGQLCQFLTPHLKTTLSRLEQICRSAHSSGTPAVITTRSPFFR